MTFVPIRDAVIIACTTESVVRLWARQGRLSTETADDGEPLYSLPDLVHLERQRREAKARHGYAMLAKRLLEGA